MHRQQRDEGAVREESGVRGGVFLAAGFLAFAVVFAVWWVGPGLFAGQPTASGDRVVEATVVKPAPCTEPEATATVRFSDGAEQREAPLNACGHGEDERIEVAVPESGEMVHSADAVAGYPGWYLPLGLGLVALSCLGGAVYALLITRRSVS
ncbi:hypothetical protein [Haloechinothrix sp. LS1_15]|uniref:hypothetical protein n=1 Tax=Haloechinothrix sp. LS1_15 TaxID=2652248 RepID=UPI002947645F|nr:hypothetical protein [Haloechinothrix sp. LS1_15]MDV6013834.1 hypothetical protein [Haloechinothrix sp. LS1_15]